MDDNADPVQNEIILLRMLDHEPMFMIACDSRIHSEALYVGRRVHSVAGYATTIRRCVFLIYGQQVTSVSRSSDVGWIHLAAANRPDIDKSRSGRIIFKPMLPPGRNPK